MHEILVESFWLALAIFLVLEGIGPMLFPKKWRAYIQSLGDLPLSHIQKMGGVFVVVGLVSVWWILR